MLDGYAERSAEQVINAIAATTTRPLARLLFGLGIPLVGETVAKALVRQFGSMDAIMAATDADITAIRGIGPEIASSVTAAFADPDMHFRIGRLRTAGCTLVDAAPVARGSAFAGQTVVITGTLPTLGRKEATALAEAHGATVSGSVSKKTSFVLAGAEAGTKLEKATQLGILVIDEASFLARIAETTDETD